MKKIYIVGASGFGREVAWLISGLDEWEVSGFIDDNQELKNKMINGYPVLGGTEYLLERNDDIYVTIAIGNPIIRKKVYDKLKNRNNIIFPNIINQRICIDESNKLGKGNIICANTILTTNITLGNFNHVNLNCTIGHDAVLEDFITVYPSVNISGAVNIESFCEVGTGSQIIQGKKINSDICIGAGSVVVKDLVEKGTYVGTPAKIIKK